MKRSFMWLAAVVLAAVVVADAGFAAGVLLTRDPAPRPLDATRVFDIARPATVLVQGNYSVQVSWADPVISKAREDQLAQKLVSMLESGQVADNEAAVAQAIGNILADAPGSWFEPGTTRGADTFTLVNSGSGFFITEDGYLVTAAHVVDTSKDDLRTEVLALEKEPAEIATARQDIAKGAHDALGINLTDAQLDRMVDWYQGWDDRYLTVDGVDAKYYLGTGSVDAGSRLESTGTRATVVKAEDPYPGRDVALLKADVTGVPALALAASAPAGGSPAYVVGYPRKGYLQEEAAVDARVPATLGAGRTLLASSQGSAIGRGTTAQVTRGDSGAPVLNAKGEVIGLLSYSEAPSDSATGNGYYIPTSLIRQTLASVNVTPRAGTLTAEYARALQEGDWRHYRVELPLLNEVHQQSAWNAYVQDDITRVQSQVLSGADQTPPALMPYLPLVAFASGLGLLAAIGLFGAAAWRRRPPVPVTAPSPPEVVLEPGPNPAR